MQEFKDDHQLETETTIGDLREMADVIIDNNGSVEELQKQVDELIK